MAGRNDNNGSSDNEENNNENERTNDELVEEAAYDFLEQERAAFSQRLATLYNTPRRVPFVTFALGRAAISTPTRSPRRRAAHDDEDNTNPAQRPRLVRQNAMEFLHPFENNQRHNANFVAFLELLNDVSAVGDDDELEVEVQAEEVQPPQQKKPKYIYTFLPATPEEDWECAVCFSKEENKVVWHPSNCHKFHHACLTHWTDEKPTCPICRRWATPILMAEVQPILDINNNEIDA
jgi:hypothetical protein